MTSSALMAGLISLMCVVGPTGRGNMSNSSSGACFFFQAEDGIRDGRVTGVQTCALPICSVSAAMGRGRKPRVLRRVRRASKTSMNKELKQLPQKRKDSGRSVLSPPRPLPPRSEERRVGKECRSRWSPDQYKNKEMIDTER